MKAKYIVRTATKKDLDELMKLEENWPENERASREHFVARIEKFDRGFFAMENDGKICASISCCLNNYEQDKVSNYKNWNTVTNNGFLYDPRSTTDYNALYIVAGVIDKNHRAFGLFERLIETVVALAKSLNLKYVTAGAVIPGYKDYCQKYGDIPAENYVFLKKKQKLVDPFLEMYRRVGFTVPDRTHVIRDYYPDEASDCYAAIVVKEVK